jgi:DNA-binding transcriptional MerR regulator
MGKPIPKPPKMTSRNAFILHRRKAGFTLAEISILLVKEGYKAVCRERVNQILRQYDRYQRYIKYKPFNDARKKPVKASAGACS